MAALVFIELDTRGHPGGRPIFTGTAVADVKVTPSHIERRVVVAIACKAAQAGILVKRVAAGRIRDKAEIFFAAEIVDPGQGSVGLGNYILALCVVKITKFHE